VIVRCLVWVAVHLHQQRPQVGQQVISRCPAGFAVVEYGDQCRTGGQSADQDAQTSGRQLPAVEIDQIYPVVALQVGLYLVAVLIEQA
jgi:hypothetical protein